MTMRYTLRLNGVIVGRSSLEHRDRARSTARGDFSPGPGYELVEPIFDLLTQARASTSSGVSDPSFLSRFEKARRTLRLELVDPRGSVLSARDVVITPSREREGRAQVELLVEDARFWSSGSA